MITTVLPSGDTASTVPESVGSSRVMPFVNALKTIISVEVPM